MNIFTEVLIKLFVIFICGGALIFLVQYYKKRNINNRCLELVEMLRIDSKTFVCLIRLKEREMLISISPSNIQLLCEEKNNISPVEKVEK